tara:strand:- start:34 stop:1245 length:1212 start_codon:yes stop_codon:yes gene_type:complete
MKMNYEKLREFLANSEKYKGCKKYKRAPLIHKGFPGTFNLSFTEYDMFREFGGYSNFPKNQIFSTIQSCVRSQDILENLKHGKGLWKYLGVFEMSDIAGQITLSKKEDIKKIHTWQLNKLIELLVKLGLKKENIYPSYCKGGDVAKITNGKYTFNFKVPEDTLTKEAFIEAGIPKGNLIPDKTRDTFLSLHINMPTPWGYRNEINYNLGTEDKPKLLDIATLEYFLWLPTYSSKEKVAKNINGLKEFQHTISIGGIGVERLCVAVNDLKSIQEIDFIKKFYDLFRKLYPSLTEEQRIKSGEVIRVLHRIYTDIENFNLKIGESQKQKVRYFCQVLVTNLGELDAKKIKRLLELHSKVQPWHKNLSKGIKPTIERIEIYFNSQSRLITKRSTKPEKHQKKKLAP